MKKTRIISIIIYVALLATAFSWAFGLFGGGTDGLSYSQVVDLFQKEQVKSFVVSEQTISLELRNPYNCETELRCPLADPESFRQEMQTVFQTVYGCFDNDFALRCFSICGCRSDCDFTG